MPFVIQLAGTSCQVSQSHVCFVNGQAECMCVDNMKGWCCVASLCTSYLLSGKLHSEYVLTCCNPHMLSQRCISSNHMCPLANSLTEICSNGT